MANDGGYLPSWRLYRLNLGKLADLRTSFSFPCASPPLSINQPFKSLASCRWMADPVVAKHAAAMYGTTEATNSITAETEWVKLHRLQGQTTDHGLQRIRLR